VPGQALMSAWSWGLHMGSSYRTTCGRAQICGLPYTPLDVLIAQVVLALLPVIAERVAIPTRYRARHLQAVPYKSAV
jgi:hypothetical protein